MSTKTTFRFKKSIKFDKPLEMNHLIIKSDGQNQKVIFLTLLILIFSLILPQTWAIGQVDNAEEQGIFNQLYEPEEKPLPSKLRNILEVYLNDKNELLVRDSLIPLDALNKIVQHFILNPEKSPDLAKNPQVAIVYLKADRGTDYALYLAVYNKLKATYQELWQAKAKRRFKKDYEQLSRKKQARIRKAIPLNIAEAEPN